MVRACKDDKLRPPGREAAFDRQVVYLVPIEQVQQKGPFDIGLAEVVKSDVLLALVAIEPFKLTALAITLFTTEVVGQGRLTRASRAEDPYYQRLYMRRSLGFKLVVHLSSLEMFGCKGEIGLKQILEAVILGKCFFSSCLNSSGSLSLARYRFFSPALELTILLHVLAKRCVVTVTFVDVRLHVVEQIRYLVDPELAI